MKRIRTCLFIFLVFNLNISITSADERYPLEPPDTSSPRATLRTLNNTMQAIKPILAKSRALGYLSAEVRQELRKLRNRSIRCFDLSQVPEGLVDDVGPEAIVLLSEILDRIELPSFQVIPDVDSLNAKKVNRWRIPHTEITIARIEKGSRQGEYLVSPETVARLREFYSKIKDLPYHSDAIIGKLGPAGGLYQYYLSSPGGLIPIGWIERLPAWTRSIHFDHTVWQWVAMMLTLLIGGLVIALIYVSIRWWTKNQNQLRPRSGVSRLLLPLSAAIIVIIIDYLIQEQIGIRGRVYVFTEISLWALFLIFVMWCIVAFGRAVAEFIIGSPKIDPRGIYASLVKTSCNLIGFVIAGIILFHGISELGVSLATILTGLGVGGLAVALAARPTIENMIGGIMILIDRPYRVGQRIKVKDHDGVVEQIGLRSTKIRLLTGHQATIPNEEMARTDIENIERRPHIRRRTDITITYDTPLEKVDKAVQIIRDILDNHEGMDPDRPPRVYFNELNPDSLNIMMIYWYHPPALWDFNAFNQSVNMQIMQAFEKEGIKFAFPTMTTYLAQENKQPLHLTVSGDPSLSD